MHRKTNIPFGFRFGLCKALSSLVSQNFISYNPGLRLAAQYDRSVSNGQKLIFHPLIFEYKNPTFGLFVTFYDVMDHI